VTSIDICSPEKEIQEYGEEQAKAQDQATRAAADVRAGAGAGTVAG